jgi:hypothetical protein
MRQEKLVSFEAMFAYGFRIHLMSEVPMHAQVHMLGLRHIN